MLQYSVTGVQRTGVQNQLFATCHQILRHTSLVIVQYRCTEPVICYLAWLGVGPRRPDACHQVRVEQPKILCHLLHPPNLEDDV